MATTTKTSKKNFECKYCGKSFAKETTLVSHMCEKKRRWTQEKETGVQFGLQAYLKFYEYTQSGKPKTYADFVESPYYIAFVKFGRHCVNIKCVNVDKFTAWLLKNNKKLDWWTKDSFYEEWLLNYMRTESAQDALERSLKKMMDYAEETEGLVSYSHYFRYGNANRICYHIASGRISPWVIYNCDSGVEFLGKLSEEQVNMIIAWIDPDFWNRAFKQLNSDVTWTKDILHQAGL